MKIGYLMQEGGPEVRRASGHGPANHVIHVFQELKKAGHQVRLLAQYDKQIWVSDDLKDFREVRVRSRRLSRKGESAVRWVQSRLHLPYLNLFDSIRFSRACTQELADHDLLYERLGWMGYGGGMAAQRLGIPLVLEVNNGDFLTELKMLGVLPKGLQLWLSVRLMRMAIRWATHIIATGEGHQRRFIEHWNVRPEQVAVVENGTELVNLLKREQLQSFKPEEAGSSRTRIVYAGALEPWQGVLVLLQAFHKIVLANRDVHLKIIGDGSHTPAIKDGIQKLELGSNVTLTGALEMQDLARHLANSDIGIAPYCGWMEFSGLKLFDYKAAGLAIVASGQAGQPATLEDGKTALIVPPCDEEALQKAIIRLVSDVEFRRELGKAGRHEAEQLHSWEHTAQEIEAIFHQVLVN